MAYFPFFIDIKNKKCCIIGGGVVAYRKIEALLEFEADLTVIAPYLCEEIKALEKKLHIISRYYVESDLEHAFLVIAATDDQVLNEAISKTCKDRNILVNVVDEMEKCNFLFPAYVKRESITIGVTTSGKSPIIAGHIKEKIKDILPDFYGDFVERMGGYRDYIKKNVRMVDKRHAIFKELARIGLEHGGMLTKEEVDSVITRTEGCEIGGFVE